MTSLDSTGPLAFDLRGLDVFLTVCDAGGMAMAARRLGITQPSVSQTIAEIEARAGTKLFDRTVRPLGLTQAGALLRERAGTLLAEARQIGPLLRQVGRTPLPLLRVGLVDSLGRALNAVLSRFLAQEAQQASIFAGLTASHASALATRQLDIVLGAEEIGDMEGLERHLLLEETYVLLLPANRAPPMDVAGLGTLAADLPLLRFSARSRTGMEIERHLRRLRLDLPRRLEFDTPHGLTAAVAAGLGWAITTPLCTHEAALDAPLRHHPLPGPGFSRRLTLIARERELGTLPERMAALCRDAIRPVRESAA